MKPHYPPPLPGNDRLTQSSLEVYLKCGIRWEFEREGGRFATVRMLIGSAVGIGARHDNEVKLEHGRGASISDVVDMAVAGYEMELGEAEVPETKFEIGKGKDDSADAARTFALRVSPAITQVVEAEAPIVAEVAENLELAGTPDYITADGVGDLKVGRHWSQAEADRTRQHHCYGLLHRARFGRYPERVWIDTVYRSKGGWWHERLWSHRTPEDYLAFLDILERARNGINAGIALPAPVAAWWCSKKWCPYWGKCPAVGKNTNGRKTS